MPPLPPHQQLAAARSSHDGSVSVPVMLHPHTEPLERLISDESPASVLLIAPPMLATLRESCLALQQARQQRRGGDFSELQQRLAADPLKYALGVLPAEVKDSADFVVVKGPPGHRWRRPSCRQQERGAAVEVPIRCAWEGTMLTCLLAALA